MEQVCGDAGGGSSDFYQFELWALATDLFPVAGVGGEACVVARDEQDASGACEPGDPAAVAGGGDEERIDLEFFQARAQLVEPGIAHACWPSAIRL